MKTVTFKTSLHEDEPPTELQAGPGLNPDITLLHFNDAHNIVPPKVMEPLGSASRFATIVKQYRRDWDSLLLFSGDCFNPSRLSTVTKGKHVSPVLKALRVDCGVYGNHDFDFGPDELIKLAEASGLPWVMTNVVDTRTNRPVSNSEKSKLLIKHGKRIGIIGIVEEEWLATIRDLPDYVQYLDKATAAKEEIKNLKARGAQIIIALTHMRQYNDTQFLKDVPDCDLLLGGHDHYYVETDVDGRKLIKSSADFVHTTFLKIWLPNGENGLRIEATKIPVLSSTKEDSEIKAIVDGYEKELVGKINKDLCRLTRELDVMTEVVRTQEVAAGNLIADIMKKEMHCDCAMVNSGVLRANLVYMPGVLKVKDILDILPMEDIVVSLLIKGSLLQEALECGVSKFPALEGRFPQVSGIEFLMDPTAKPMQRVKDIRIRGKPLNPHKTYKLATTSYLSGGGDGYTPLKEHSGYIVEIENGRILPTMVRQYMNDLPGENTKLERRMSVASAKEAAGSTEEGKMAAQTIREAYLPIISPILEGRIIINDELSRLPKIPTTGDTASVCSAMSAMSKHSVFSRTSGIRRTSMAHPIQLTRTLVNLTNTKFSHETQDDELAELEGGSSNGSQTGSDDESTKSKEHHLSLPVSKSPVSIIPKPQSRKRRVTDGPKHALQSLQTPLRSPHSIPKAAKSEVIQLNPADATKFDGSVANLFDAAMQGDLDVTTALLANARNPITLVNDKGVPSHCDVEKLRVMGLGTTMKEVATPLHYAIACGQLAAVETLLRQGSNTKIRNQMGGNARELAFAHLVMAHSRGSSEDAAKMENIIEMLDVYEDSMTDEMRYLLDQM